MSIYVCLGKIKLRSNKREYYAIKNFINRFIYYICTAQQGKYTPLGRFDPGTPASKAVYIVTTLWNILALNEQVNV